MYKRIIPAKTFFIGLSFLVCLALSAYSRPAYGIHYTLSWIPPTTNYNGSPLTDLAGYRLYYGTASNNYSSVINIGNNTTYTVNNLTEGHTYFFSVTAYDVSGNESVYSNEIIKTAAPSNTPPVADPGILYSGVEGQAINLDGTGSVDSDGTIALYEWDIDSDGIYEYSSPLPTGRHIYDKQGIYTIKLRVSDNIGAAGEASTEAYISDSAPTAVFTGYPASGSAPLAVTFSNTSSGYDQPLNYEWDFDNNGSVDSTLRDTVHTYSKPGTYTVRLTVRDKDGSINTITRTDYITVNEYILSCDDGGAVECMTRTDGGSDSNNLVDGKPRIDVEYEFRVKVKDTSGRTPQYVKLYMIQRSYPAAEDFYSYRMSCTGNYDIGGLCTYNTKLGPAAVHKFYFKAQFSDGTVRRYPDIGYITGPEVQLVRGFNFVGVPRDIGNSGLDGYTAFGTTFAYRWTSGGYYAAVTSTDPVIQGEGYYIRKQADTLPELAEYGEIQESEIAYRLNTGWNIVSNPYSGNVELSEIKIRKGTQSTSGWMEAVSNGWTVNSVYYGNGRDWTDQFLSESAPQAKLVPWIGYWVYLYMTDDDYYLVIPRPQQ